MVVNQKTSISLKAEQIPEQNLPNIFLDYPRNA